MLTEFWIDICVKLTNKVWAEYINKYNVADPDDDITVIRCGHQSIL